MSRNAQSASAKRKAQVNDLLLPPSKLHANLIFASAFVFFTYS